MNLASFFGTDGGGGTKLEPVPTPRPKKRPTKRANAKILGAAPSPKPGVVIKPKSYLARNVAFDKKRTDAMRQVYEGKTKKALTTFQDAQRMRPGDPSVKMWMDAIKQSAQKPRDAAPQAASDFKSATQQLRVPTQAAPANAVGAGVGAPALPQPAPVNAPQEVDPRLVF